MREARGALVGDDSFADEHRERTGDARLVDAGMLPHVARERPVAEDGQRPRDGDRDVRDPQDPGERGARDLLRPERLSTRPAAAAAGAIPAAVSWCPSAPR